MTTKQLAEETILYGLASGADGWSIKEARKKLFRSDFKSEHHIELFDALIAIDNRGEAINPDSFIRELTELESLGAFGGEDAVRDLISVSKTFDFDEELFAIKSKSALKKILEYANEKDQRQAIENIKKIVENCALPTPSKLELKFISEISPDYFKTKPPAKPRLLYFVEKDGKKVDFLHKGIVGMLVAEGGRGKTHLLALLAACIATGIPWLKEFMIEKPGAVCLIVGENDPDDIHRLLWKIREHLSKMLAENKLSKDHERFMLHSQDPIEQLASNLLPRSTHGQDASFINERGEKTDFYKKLVAGLKAKEPDGGWQMIILDPVSRFAGPEAEKDNAIATSFIASLENISNELKGKPTILLAHHKSKAALRDSAGQADARGSSGLTDGVRWQANLNKISEDKDSSWLEISKTNFTAIPKKVRIKKDREGVPVFDGVDDLKPEAPKDKKKEERTGHKAIKKGSITRI